MDDLGSSSTNEKEDKEKKITDREQYTPGPAGGAQVRKDGENWTLILVRELRHSPEKVWKEWAYAGFFFAMSGAVFSHIASGDSMNEIVPSLLLLILIVVSWYFRPADRKIISVNQ